MSGANPITIGDTTSDLDYQIQPLSSPIYRDQIVHPQNGTNYTVTNAIGNIQFLLPNADVNLNQSYLLFTATPAAKAAVFNWMVLDCLAPFDEVMMYDARKQMIVDTKRVAETSLLMRGMKPVSVGESQDKYIASGTQFEPMVSSDLLSAVNYRIDTTTNNERNYLTARHLAVSTASNSATPVLNFKIPFSSFAGINLLGDNKVLPLRFDTYLQINFNPYTKWALHSVDATDPTSTPTAWDANIPLTGIELHLAVNTNVEVSNALTNKIKSGGLELINPHTETAIQSIASTTPSTSFKLNVGGFGDSLCRVFYSLFDATEQAGTLYKCGGTGYLNALATIYSTVNSTRRTDRNLTPTQMYEAVSHLLKGSMVLDRDSFYHQMFFLDDFSGLPSLAGNVGDLYNKRVGMPLISAPTYSVICTANAATAYTHVACFQCQKTFRITESGYVV